MLFELKPTKQLTESASLEALLYMSISFKGQPLSGGRNISSRSNYVGRGLILSRFEVERDAHFESQPMGYADENLNVSLKLCNMSV